MIMGKKKILIHAAKKCGGVLLTEYSESNIPALVCELCGHRVDDWQKWDQQYKLLWEDKTCWNDKRNHLSCILGYFCAIYKDSYGLDFTISLNENGLFRGPEMNIFRRIYSMLGSDALVVKDYIDYFFQVRVKQRKKKISSLGSLAVPDIIQEFKLAAKKAEQIDRNTALPPKMIEWVNKFTPDVNRTMVLKDFGDLNVLLKYFETGLVKKTDDVVKFVGKLQQLGYIDDSFKIKNWRDLDA